MELELAKELRDAKFPVKKHLIFRYKKDVAVPTLSELIDACGDEFGRLGTSPGAFPKWGVCDWADNEYATGETPEEAVARLWLALQKK